MISSAAAAAARCLLDDTVLLQPFNQGPLSTDYMVVHGHHFDDVGMEYRADLRALGVNRKLVHFVDESPFPKASDLFHRKTVITAGDCKV